MIAFPVVKRKMQRYLRLHGLLLELIPFLLLFGGPLLRLLIGLAGDIADKKVVDFIHHIKGQFLDIHLQRNRADGILGQGVQ